MISDVKLGSQLSGGVDSSVAALLLHKAIGENLHCIFVDNGLLRKNEFNSVLDQYKGMGLNVKGVDASEYFIKKLSGIDEYISSIQPIGVGSSLEFLYVVLSLFKT